MAAPGGCHQRGSRVTTALADGRVGQLTPSVGTYNFAAIRVYGAAGFVGTGHEARALRIGDDYIDEMIMTLDLR